MNHLHFSIGPVQSFVGKSRRTRDLWGSSYLLSLLAGEALAAISSHNANAEFVLPALNLDESNKAKKLVQAIRDTSFGTPPEFGSLPNRFVVGCDDPAEAAAEAESAVNKAFRRIADKVWETYVEEIAEAYGKNTEEIWNCQVESFWSIYWVVDEDGDQPEALDRRKNWRSHAHPPQSGDKCTVMHRFQEVSGYTSTTNDGRGNQKDFWTELRNELGAFDLRDDERLCAIALIKRLYPKVLDDALEGNWNVDKSGWPSTAYMAVAPWLAEVLDSEYSESVESYAKHINEVSSGRSVRSEEATDLQILDDCDGLQTSLDGNVFLETALKNPRATPLGLPDEDDDWDGDGICDERKQLVRQLTAIGNDQIDAASPFYALLLMDGDSMGAMLQAAARSDQSDQNDPTSAVSGALTAFAGKVDDIVTDHSGVTIYAGGDDVMAMLPRTTAVECAAELRAAYLEQFGQRTIDDAPIADALDLDGDTTISAGLVYSHYSYPLEDVLNEAHHLLDDVAKDQTGRDAIAVAGIKQSGKQYEWAVEWDRMLCEDEEDTLLTRLVNRYHDGDYTTGFIYNLRELLMMFGEGGWSPGQVFELPQEIDREDMTDLWMSQYASSTNGDIDEETAHKAVDPLLDACWVQTDGDRGTQTEKLTFDAPLLVRFLADQKQTIG